MKWQIWGLLYLALISIVIIFYYDWFLAFVVALSIIGGYIVGYLPVQEKKDNFYDKVRSCIIDRALTNEETRYIQKDFEINLNDPEVDIRACNSGYWEDDDSFVRVMIDIPKDIILEREK